MRSTLLSHNRSVRALITIAVLTATAVIAVTTITASNASPGRDVTSKTFPMFANQAFVGCARAPGATISVSATVTRGARSDLLTLSLTGFKPNLGFDLFTVQRSNQTATGAAVSGFTNFGLAWYQSDIETNSSGNATVAIRTILFDQIFGFDPDASLAPTNTFHLGFWFDSVAEAQPCSATTLTPTPFNGEHTAGPLAFITRPNATTGLGPLCTKPVQHAGVFTCQP